MTTKLQLNRRQALMAGATGIAGSMLPGFSSEALAQGAGMEYVFLSVVTQVPFWRDHRDGLEAASEALGVKTTFTGPLDFDTAGQARQLDELIVRRPAGILIFPGDVGALEPGIARATEAGIPVAMIIGDAPDSGRMMHLGISNFEAGKEGGKMLAEAVGGKGKVLLGTFPAPSVLERVEGYKAYFAEHAPEIEVVDVINDKADPIPDPDGDFPVDCRAGHVCPLAAPQQCLSRQSAPQRHDPGRSALGRRLHFPPSCDVAPGNQLDREVPA